MIAKRYLPEYLSTDCPAGYHQTQNEHDISSLVRCNCSGLFMGKLPIRERLVCDNRHLVQHQQVHRCKVHDDGTSHIMGK